MKTAVISEQGRRLTMEDAYFLDGDFVRRGWLYAGIYDGHGGKEAAQHVAGRLHELVAEGLLSAVPPQQAFGKSYEAVSDEMGQTDSGTTAADVLITGQTVHAANVGDTRTIVVGKKQVHQLSKDHRVDDPAERRRIEQSGGKIVYPYAYRGVQGMMPTRTLGDSYFKPIGVIATPSVREYAISEDDLVLVMGCDGLFDFMDNEEVASFARRYQSMETLLEGLKEEVLLNRSGTDNLTIIAISLAE